MFLLALCRAEIYQNRIQFFKRAAAKWRNYFQHNTKNLCFMNKTAAAVAGSLMLLP
jgi:hypothetical protein